jgi:hypothetical protein
MQSYATPANHTDDPMTMSPSKRKITRLPPLPVSPILRRKRGPEKIGILTLLAFIIVLNTTEANAFPISRGGIESNGRGKK